MKRRTARWEGAGNREGREGSADGTASEEVRKGGQEPCWERRLRRGDLAAVAETRAGLRRFLEHWGAPGRAETAELLTSELVTNALLHTDGGAVVSAVLTGGPAALAKGRLRVEVRDLCARRPALRASAAAPDPGNPGGGTADVSGTATSGRGLLLVDSLADCWGVRAHGVGKAVWFELDAEDR
ncbi:ATP-binding protein [Streptomyces sp. AV19]|uniref:ATP-binding protein n=1 Tax=Streptomyces sp. AV19 TaxID=2793068 RepID=UPI0018FEFA9E|nr:ATP-binding protein [Streptomyces sp. AV19]